MEPWVVLAIFSEFWIPFILIVVYYQPHLPAGARPPRFHRDWAYAVKYAMGEGFCVEGGFGPFSRTMHLLLASGFAHHAVY